MKKTPDLFPPFLAAVSIVMVAGTAEGLRVSEPRGRTGYNGCPDLIDCA
jgi:hypothetical protein